MLLYLKFKLIKQSAFLGSTAIPSAWDTKGFRTNRHPTYSFGKQRRLYLKVVR